MTGHVNSLVTEAYGFIGHLESILPSHTNYFPCPFSSHGGDLSRYLESDLRTAVDRKRQRNTHHGLSDHKLLFLLDYA